MKDIGDICRGFTSLTAMQIELWRRIGNSLHLAADVAGAKILMCAPSRQNHELILLAFAKPHTVIIDDPAQKINLLPIIHDSLAAQVLATGKSAFKERENSLGQTLLKEAWPVCDNGQKIGVISLELIKNRLPFTETNILLQTAKSILRNARKLLPAGMCQSMSAGDGLIIADKFKRIIYANEAALGIYRRLGVGSVVGRRLADGLLTRYAIRETTVPGCPYEREFVVGGRILHQRDMAITNGGVLERQIVILADVTELRQKERELATKSAIIQEIHHRVKNNLQTIASLLRLQARRSTSPEVKAALKESVSRILSTSAVHEFLSQQEGESIDLATIAQNIFTFAKYSMVRPDFYLQAEYCGQKLLLPSDVATSLALIINELTLNAIEHGFRGRHKGSIRLSLAALPMNWQLDFTDDGLGLPPNFSAANTNSLGLSIIRTLVENDLGGSFSLSTGDFPAGNTLARIVWPRET